MKIGNFLEGIEILFRAKHVHACKNNDHLDGIWVYGYLCNGNYIYSEELEGEFLIDRNTIGQYTGVDDDDQVKIFTGDIIEDRYGNDYEVSFINGGYVLIPCKEETKHDVFRKWLHELSGESKCIVGNIYDTPEMF